MDVSSDTVEQLKRSMSYQGHPKHKRNPAAFKLEPFRGERGDATLCDDHAGLQPADMGRIKDWICRGLDAALIGTNMVWVVADDGWIFEGRMTNADTGEYHGYPVRPNEAIAEPVYRRYRAWAETHGSEADQTAANNCADRYGFR